MNPFQLSSPFTSNSSKWNQILTNLLNISNSVITPENFVSNYTGDFFSNVNLLANTDYKEVKFVQDDDNHVTLDKSSGNTKVLAHFTHGEQLKNLPTNYNSYRVELAKDATITTNDTDAILSWQTATEIKVLDETSTSDVALVLFQRAAEFKTKNLQVLSVSLHADSSVEIVAKPFFDSIKSLKTLYFYIPAEFDSEVFVNKLSKDKSVKVEQHNTFAVSVTRKTMFERLHSKYLEVFP